jgi:hypothetical protein
VKRTEVVDLGFGKQTESLPAEHDHGKKVPDPFSEQTLKNRCVPGSQGEEKCIEGLAETVGWAAHGTLP